MFVIVVTKTQVPEIDFTRFVLQNVVYALMLAKKSALSRVSVPTVSSSPCHTNFWTDKLQKIFHQLACGLTVYLAEQFPVVNLTLNSRIHTETGGEVFGAGLEDVINMASSIANHAGYVAAFAMPPKLISEQ